MKHTLPNGIVLDPDDQWARGATDYAKRKGFNDLVVCRATEPPAMGGKESYLLLRRAEKGMDPVYENTSYEAIAVHIDILAADRDLTPAQQHLQELQAMEQDLPPLEPEDFDGEFSDG